MPSSDERLERIDAMIDALNAETEPDRPLDAEEAELLATARLVKRLRASSADVQAGSQGGLQPGRQGGAQPGSQAGMLAGRQAGDQGDIRAGVQAAQSWARSSGRRRQHGPRWKRWALVAAVAAAVAGYLVIGNPGTPWTDPGGNPVEAMSRAVASLQTYYGVLEKRVQNEAGDDWLVRRVEIWHDGDRYATRDDQGVVTVNDGARRWQLRPQENRVVHLPPLPDPRPFDLHDEAERALRYPHEVVGLDTVAGRQAIHLRILPPGGLPYDLWIDAETDLPLQLRSAMQNALQTTYTFTSFEPNASIDAQVFAFALPGGYVEVEDDFASGQWVDTPAEAAEIAGFDPLFPQSAPERMIAAPGWLMLEFGSVVLFQKPAEGALIPEPDAALGEAAGGVLEARQDRLRWQQAGIEVEVYGPTLAEAEAIARELAPDLVMPHADEQVVAGATVPVEVDLEIAARDQQQVDAGHSPWLVDPRQVAAVFAFTTAGMNEGEGQPPFDTARVVVNTGREAVVEWDEGPIARVYLQRLVRVDETGVWSVVGYDPR